VNYIGWDENNTPYEIAKRSGVFYHIELNKELKTTLGKKLEKGTFKICEANED
jgi:threonyl-tRNA synthetase